MSKEPKEHSSGSISCRNPEKTQDRTKVDLIDRQAAIEDIRTMIPKDARLNIKWIEMWLMQLPSAQPERRYDEWCTDCKEYDKEKHCCPRWNRVIRTTLQEARRTGRWIPASERLPEDLEEVNITFTNLEPEPYYDFIKGKRFTGSAVFYKGEWYWYSSITVDVLNEYGRYDSEKIDESIKIIAWQSLPEPYREVEE